MTRPGFSIESAASITLRDTITKHTHAFAHVIKADRAASQSTVSAYIDGLAGAAALTIAGGHGSREDIVDAVIAKLREAVDRDLRHLGNVRS
jgi:hypothetical protein